MILVEALVKLSSSLQCLPVRYPRKHPSPYLSPLPKNPTIRRRGGASRLTHFRCSLFCSDVVSNYARDKVFFLN